MGIPKFEKVRKHAVLGPVPRYLTHILAPLSYFGVVFFSTEVLTVEFALQILLELVKFIV